MNIAGNNYPQTAQYKNSHCMLSFQRDSGDTSLCPYGINQCSECHVYIQLRKGSILDHLLDALSQRIKENEAPCNADDKIRHSELTEILNGLKEEIESRFKVGVKTLNTSNSVAEVIANHRECTNKSICNCFNKDNPTLICGDVRICTIINYYEGMINNYEDILNDVPIEKPHSKVTRKVKLKLKINKKK